MRYAPHHKQLTRERIREAAARLFRRKGYAATGVDTIMAAAGMTAGGFYGHYRSKEALLGDALDTAFLQSTDRTDARRAELGETEQIRRFVETYLSSGHRDAPEHGCPMPALAADVSRLKPRARSVFENHLRRRIADIGAQLGRSPEDDCLPIAALATCVGGLMLARAVKDRAFSDHILEACRTELLRDVDGTGQ